MAGVVGSQVPCLRPLKTHCVVRLELAPHKGGLSCSSFDHSSKLCGALPIVLTLLYHATLLRTTPLSDIKTQTHDPSILTTRSRSQLLGYHDHKSTMKSSFELCFD
ncbi:hypothetical protein TNCV_2916131 [Trichonephila clavipes]|nr:hypothetical protein TNCV_2916131 [Trichonephila clavipes]